VKQRSPGSGFGGDWAVRITAAKSPALKEAESAPDAPRVRKKLALFFYVADGAWKRGSLDVVPAGDPVKVTKVR
jgi:hypothetical protein